MEINQGLYQRKKKNITVTILVILIIIVLIISGYFAFKYYSQKTSQELATTTPESTKTTTSREVKDLINILKYPQAETVNNGKEVSQTQTNDFIQETKDSVVTVYNYYINLASRDYWSLGSRNVSADEDSAFLSIKEKDFTVDITLKANSGNNITHISIDIKIGSYAASNDHDYEIIKATATPSSSAAVSASPTPAADEKVSITGDYVISDSNSRVIETSELAGLLPWELKVARNEIYARHGREFVHKDMQCYFDTKSWYSKNSDFSETDLTSTEIKNISIILEYEKQIESLVMDKDLGC